MHLLIFTCVGSDISLAWWQHDDLSLTVDSLSRNNLLWLHTVFAVLYLIVTVVLLRHYTSQMKGMRRETVSV